MNGFYVTKKTAKKFKLKKVSDLKKVAKKLTFGGPPECLTRPLCLGDLSQKLYGLKFSDVKKLDPGGPITVSALENGDIDVALLFTGSSVIPKDAVLLTDDKGLQPADNPVFLMTEGDGIEEGPEGGQRRLGEAHHGCVQQDVVRHQREEARPR